MSPQAGPDDQSDTVEQILRATSVSGWTERVRFLGPYAKKLSFVSQQNRALNLVAALRKGALLPMGSNVAVVGGGVAGLMAAVALTGSNCLVTVYEQRRMLLGRQRNAVHRYIHPSVNSWPSSELNPTTSFPFFDWYAAECSEVVRSLEEEWKRDFADKMVEVHASTSIQGLEESGSRVRVVCDPAGASADFDMVLVTTGFSDEHGFPGAVSPSYWRPDALDHMRDFDEGPFTVSGCGDGGVIDALRLVHRDFRAGRLVAEMAREMTVCGIAASLAVAMKAGEPLAAKRAADVLPRSISNRLAASLDGRKAAVRLIGRRTSPFEASSAAPVHQVLLAHAMQSGAITFVQGEVKPSTAGAMELHVAGNVTPEPLDPSTTVIRHGPGSVLASLLDAEQIADLEHKQSILSDYHATAIWRRLGIGQVAGCPPFNPVDPAFVKSRFDRARRLEFDHPAVRLHIRDGAFGYQLWYDGNTIPSLPTHLFGIKLEPHVKESGSPF